MRLPLVVLLAASTVILQVQAAEPMRVYTARSIITMDESLPRARAVAVADGRILAVGNLETMGAWLAAREYEIDRRFADKILVPGLIDNHLHPLMATMLLNTRWITPQRWSLPGRRGTDPGREGPSRQGRAAVASRGAGENPFITWGLPRIVHGLTAPGPRPDRNRLPGDPLATIFPRSRGEFRSPRLAWLRPGAGRAARRRGLR